MYNVINVYYNIHKAFINKQYKYVVKYTNVMTM